MHVPQSLQTSIVGKRVKSRKRQLCWSSNVVSLINFRKICCFITFNSLFPTVFYDNNLSIAKRKRLLNIKIVKLLLLLLVIQSTNYILFARYQKHSWKLKIKKTLLFQKVKRNTDLQRGWSPLIPSRPRLYLVFKFFVIWILIILHQISVWIGFTILSYIIIFGQFGFSFLRISA